MKKMYKLLLVFVAIAAISTFISCEGPAGSAGAPGTNGIDGQDGTATCTQCHDSSQLIKTKQVQYNVSVHATGMAFERNSETCAPCHTSQGFLERIATGEKITQGVINNPTPTNCYTCHNIHDTYSTADWALTVTDQFNLWIADENHDMGKANLCASCHQPLLPSPLPVEGGDNVVITSPYWGPHHAPQAAFVVGSSPYEVSGSSTYENSAHTTAVTDGCVTCHMADPYGKQAGGHQMGLSYLYHGSDHVWTAGCTSCHTDADALETKMENAETVIAELLATLEAALVEKGVISEAGARIIPGTYSPDLAGAYINYEMVHEDHGAAHHNYKYVKALLENTNEALAKK